MADVRALLCGSAVGGFFYDAGDSIAVVEWIFYEILTTRRDEQLWRGNVVQGPGRAQQRHAFSL